MEIVYLDQNKWIELARAHVGKNQTSAAAEVYPQLLTAVAERKALCPLSAASIIETSKRNDPVSRAAVAEVQAALSRGYVYCSYAERIEVEARTTICRLFRLGPVQRPVSWPVVPGFLRAFGMSQWELVPDPRNAQLLEIVEQTDPASLYLDYITGGDDSVRRQAHAILDLGVGQLIKDVESRRTQWAKEPLDVRRRANMALLFMKHQEVFARVAAELGGSLAQIQALGDEAVRSLTERSPTLQVEAELAIRLEAKTGELNSHDVFDLQALYTAIPYSQRVIAEKAAVSRARQAKLDVAFPAKLSQRLEDLLGVFSGAGEDY